MEDAEVNLIRRIFVTVTIGALAAAVVAAAPAAANTELTTVAAPKPVAWDATTGAELQAWSCSTGNVCFWTGPDGTGSRCMWDIADPNWTTGSYRCSWATSQNVKSVWNRGTSTQFSGVAYYLQTEYRSRVGCTRRGQSGNLAGTYNVLSHRWITGSCG